MENQTVWKPGNQGDKEETFIQTSRRGGDGQPGGEDSRQGGCWRTRAVKAAAGGPFEVADCGMGWAKLQLTGVAATGRNSNRPCSPGLQLREIKPQTSD